MAKSEKGAPTKGRKRATERPSSALAANGSSEAIAGFDVKALVSKGIEPSLLLFAMLDAQEVLLGKVESSGHGTGRLPSEILLDYLVTMPAPNVQQALATTFDSINGRIATRREESRPLGKLRDGLLPQLLSGSLTNDSSVPQAEMHL